MVTRFNTVYDRMNQAMDGFPYKEIGISEEGTEQVIIRKMQLQKHQRQLQILNRLA